MINPVTQAAEAADEKGSEQSPEETIAKCCPPPTWMPIAWRELGISEIQGPETNPRVMEYHAASGFTWKRGTPATLDDSRSIDAWCSSFVTWVMIESGYPKNKLANESFRARMWHDDWNNGINIGDPIYGLSLIHI